MDTAFDKQMAHKRAVIADRESDTRIPKMGDGALQLEHQIFVVLSEMCPLVQGVHSKKGSGIFTYSDGQRTFKVELSQVDGPA